jgi:hypothetical protein
MVLGGNYNSTLMLGFCQLLGSLNRADTREPKPTICSGVNRCFFLKEWEIRSVRPENIYFSFKIPLNNIPFS